MFSLLQLMLRTLRQRKQDLLFSDDLQERTLSVLRSAHSYLKSYIADSTVTSEGVNLGLLDSLCGCPSVSLLTQSLCWPESSRAGHGLAMEVADLSVPATACCGQFRVMNVAELSGLHCQNELQIWSQSP